jgi:succinate dehydrogenase / fumarate reductase cytochrome b subunit
MMSEGEKVARGAANPLFVLRDFLLSSVGAKVVMSLSGAALWAFIVVHLAGNLQIFAGAEVINEYGVKLRSLGPLFWVARIGIYVIFAIHIFYGLRLAALNRRARGVEGYRVKKPLRTTPMALTMATSGLIILAFFAFHIAHFTLGIVDPVTHNVTDAAGRHDIFSMLVAEFKKPAIVVIYLIGQTVLLSHLIHGTQSLWQSLGIFHPVWTPVIRIAGRAIAALIFAGNIAIPLAILFWK